jgi:uncharacterized membrane protein
MTDITPSQVVVASFSEENAATETLKLLEDIRRQAKLDFDDAAIIRKDDEGKLHIKETGDTTTSKGAGIGAVVGGVIGLLAGPTGVVLGASAGTVVGGLAAKGDAGIKDERLEALGNSLAPGTSAVVIVVPEVWVESVISQLETAANEVMTEILTNDVAQKLTGNDAAA